MHAFILLDDARALDRLGGISIARRAVRTVRDAGVGRVRVLSSLGGAADEVLAQDLRAATGIEVEVVAQTADSAASLPAGAAGDERVLVVRGDRVLDVRLLRHLLTVAAPNVLMDSRPLVAHAPLHARLTADSRGMAVGAALVSASWLVEHGAHVAALAAAVDGADPSLGVVDAAEIQPYSSRIRRSLRPYWFPAPEPGARRQAERILLDATQKGCQDLPALFHAPIEKAAASLLSRFSWVTPNQITVVTNLVAWTATACFATGRLRTGLILALAVGLLDGIDGKLARLKLQTSTFGELEHHFDMLYEISWWMAIAYYLHASGTLANAWALAVLLAVAEAADAVAKLTVIRRTGRLIDEFGPFDRLVRLFGGRRNIYVWILSIGTFGFAAPAAAYALIPWWELVTATIHLPRAFLIVRRASARPPS